MIMKSPRSGVVFWATELGLFPVPLYADRNQEFILLNGTRGNFCLDLQGSELGEETRSRAWSSNVGHYLSIRRGKIEVQRWDKANASIERYDLDDVYKSLETFHSYLEAHSPKQDMSVVSHSIRVFRKLRALLGREHDGVSSLQAFLYLLACSKDNIDRSSLILDQWNIDPRARSIALSISEANWTSLSSELATGRQVDRLKPDLTLILRHASGQLFEEAHYVAILDPQLTLDGFLPSVPSIHRPTHSVWVFTPAWLVRTLVEQVIASLNPLPDSLTIFDPACGSGEFLREALRQLNLRKYPGPVNLIGWDNSEPACAMARFILKWELRDSPGIGEVTVDVCQVDSLDPQWEWPAGVDMVLMNPPFVSWPALDDVRKTYMRTTLGRMLTGRSDLSHAFLWKSIGSLRHGGVLGTVLPASSLDTKAALKLREQVAMQMSPCLIARLGSQVLFSGAMIDAGLYVAKKDDSATGAAIAFWADYHLNSTSRGLRVLRKIRQEAKGQDFGPAIAEGYSIYPSTDLGRGSNSWAPRPYASLKLLQSVGNLPKVQDLFYVTFGVRTGLNAAFLISKDTWLALQDGERGFFRNAIINKSIRDGFLSDIVFCFYPYGKYRIETEEELFRKLPTYFPHLHRYKDQLVKRPDVAPERWWELNRPREDWQTKVEPKIVSTYFGRAGSFAWDVTGTFLVVQGWAWLPRNKPLTSKVGLAYLALLNSPMFSELLSAVSNNVGGGQWDLSARFVNKIAIPDLSSGQFDPDVLSRLTDAGMCICRGDIVSDGKLNELMKLAYRFDWDA